MNFALSAFSDHLKEVVGPEWAERVLQSMQQPKRRAFYHNALAGNLPDLPCRSLSLQHFYEYLGDDDSLTHHPATEDGAIYPMNPSSALPVAALAAQPGQEVLDLAAAPGGKTLLIAGCMENQGRIAAVEAVKGRFHRLRANLDRCGVQIAQCYLDDGRRTGRKTGERFDAVLLDAPCSSEARIRLDVPSSFEHWSTRKIKETSRKQRGLIRSAYAALKPGGTLVYSTCSFAVEENELVVAYLLKHEPQAEVLALAPPPQEHMPGLTEWRDKTLPNQLALSMRVLPDDLWDGFFYAKILKPAASG